MICQLCDIDSVLPDPHSRHLVDRDDYVCVFCRTAIHGEAVEGIWRLEQHLAGVKP